MRSLKDTVANFREIREALWALQEYLNEDPQETGPYIYTVIGLKCWLDEYIKEVTAEQVSGSQP